MSLDRTLRLGGGLARTRSVLTRAERIAKLTEEEKFDKDKDNPFGLPKVRVHHSRAGHKAKKEVKAAEGAEGAAAPGAAAPAGAAPAAGAKGKAPAAAPAAGAKGKAPAGKADAKKK
jgi:small basic protein (TIGR04137 family)